MSEIQTQLLGTLYERGFALIKAYRPELSTLDAFADFGQIVSLPGIRDVQPLEPKEVHEVLPNSYSGNYGKEAFPLHTDLAHWFIPPRYLALRCKVGDDGVGTRILHSSSLIAAIGSSSLRRALMKARKPMNGHTFLLRVSTDHRKVGSFVRWDRLFLTPGTQEGAIVFRLIDDFLASASFEEVVLTDPGDTLVIDNWVTLHGRSPVFSPASPRKIERVYLEQVI